jgi:ribosomal protein S8
MQLKLTVLLSFFCSCIFAQDTLVLCEKKDPAKEYKIELKKYPVKIISVQNDIYHAFLMDYKDSMVFIRSRDFGRETTQKIKDLFEKASYLADSLKLKSKQVDSLMLTIRKTETELMYSIDTSIAVSQIKKIKIDNRFRPEKKQRVKNVERTSYIALIGTPLILAASVFLLPPTTLPYIVVPVFAAGVTFAIVNLVLEKKRLNFKSTWTVKKLIKN